MQTELVRHFCRTHSVGKILLVGKYQEDGVAQFVFVQHTVQFITSGINTVRVVRVDHKDKTLRVLVIVTPQGTDLILTTDVPHCERDVLVLDGLDVESNRRNRGDNCGESFSMTGQKNHPRHKSASSSLKALNRVRNLKILPKISLTFTELELVENGSLTGGVETDHKNTHLFLAEL